ncbi:hypothetical protein Q7P37_006789 [Cladosporium fusiforme]
MADKRFAALASDPRYRLPSKKQAQTAVDPRFKRLFTDQGFQKKAAVDRYGRKLKPNSGKKDIEKRFRLEEDDDEDNEPKKGKAKRPTREVVGSSDESEEESDDEEDLAARDPARQGGFDESSSEEETSSEEEDSADEDELADATAGGEQTEAVPMGEVSKRIAAVNLDWDNIRAADIMAVASSFAPTAGRVESVTIFPSEFGKERMEREELEGPPREIFASTKRKEESDESDSDDDEDEKIKKRLIKEQAEEGEEFDDAKLRQYQLERLRYYYAIIECDSDTTAKAVYDDLDNREYLTTSNFFDLRFVPDEVTFDEDTPREQCTKLPDGYKPNDFRTEALTHSKVHLTWDADDTTRKEVQKRAFSRAELDENDLQAYIGSDSSDNDSVSSRKSVSIADRKANKREAERQKMRAALGLSEESSSRPKKAKDEPVGDMQITFSSGLNANKDSKGVFENEPQDEESTRQRYIRKEKERKQRRKEKNKPTQEGEQDEHSGAEPEAAPADNAAADEEDPFNDPFFNDPAAAAVQEKNARKADKAKKRAEREAEEKAAESRRAELELLMADDEANGEGVRHFDMREIEKAEKEARRKGKSKGKKSAKKGEEAVKDDFKVEAEDPRFKALFDSHEYAIDPTNPRFKSTEGMKSLLEEGRKKRKRVDQEGGSEEPAAAKKKGKAGKEAKADGDDELKGLVARLKKGKSKSK